MAKDRMAVTCNGRTAFYACMYEDIRQCAMDCGWAVSLHGSLASDMDIMAMPWVDNAVSFKEMVDRISKLFKDNDMSSQYVITYNEKPHNRIVATIPIMLDFYLDISTINTANVVPKSENVIELPCKVGTTLYFLYNSPYADKPDLTPRIYKTTDWYFEVDKTGIVINTSDIHSFNKKYDYYLGETVFLTKQEAEQAFAKMKGGAE